MTKEEFLNGKSSPVNKELMQIFLQCHIVEQTGHGVPKIVKKYGPESYEFWTSMITVTIPFAKTGFESNQNVTEKSITDEEKIILAIKKTPNISTTELAKIIDKSRRTIARIIENSDKIVRVGPDNGGHWEIKNRKRKYN